MIPADCSYVAATSVDHAIDLLRQHGDGAKLLAGGHTLLPVLRLRMAAPEMLIDIGKLTELKGIHLDSDQVRIGALTTHGEIARSGVLGKKLPLMVDAADKIADPLVRNRGTIGGSLVNSDPSADWPAVVLALNANMRLKGGGGERWVPAGNFFTGLFSSTTKPDEILTEITIPYLPANAQSVYLKCRHPASGYAVVGIACVWIAQEGVCKEVRIGVTGVGERPYRATSLEEALSGGSVDLANIEESALLITDGIEVLSDGFADRTYRSNLARVFAVRALRAVAGL